MGCSRKTLIVVQPLESRLHGAFAGIFPSNSRIEGDLKTPFDELLTDAMHRGQSHPQNRSNGTITLSLISSHENLSPL